VPALEILAAALLLFGSVLVFRVLIETDHLLDEATPLEALEPEAEEAPPLRRAA
jgi:hypothetical protein